MYDLHIHTKASDGVYSAEEIIDNAIKIGLEGIAITDHDTVDGLSVAKDYLKKLKTTLKFVPGIELNTDYKDVEVHILGYFIDYYHQPLLDKLIEIKQSRYERAAKMVERLHNIGLIISFEDVKRMAEGGVIARPHIAQALMDKGYVFSVKEAFNKYISKGRPGYVPRYKFSPDEAISLIKESGGIAVLAHPGLIKNGNIVEEIIKMGIEGIEVYYPQHHPILIDNYLKICNENGLLVTGGSDFHGIGAGDSHGRLGSTGINQILFKKLQDFHIIKKNS
ncbi:MAG TPA: PHP domain-containing protein [Syntrophomonadaceae bacterium]|nr:PHP domain-containing protein [Syntrophomonadaceae bacterium]